MSVERPGRVEIRRDTKNPPVGFRLEMIHEVKKERLSRLTSKSYKSTLPTLQESIMFEHKGREKTTRVYLYLQLHQATNIPQQAEKMKLQMEDGKHKVLNTLNQQDEVPVDRLSIEKPTFTILLDQDSLDDFNAFSDNPLRIMLYARKVVRPKGSAVSFSGDGDEDKQILLAEGYIDLLQYFSKKRHSSLVDIYLYPTLDHHADMSGGTCKMSWQIYSLLPMLKDLTFNNIAFITLESVYNPPAELLEADGRLTANFYFRSRIPDASNKFKKVEICNFRTFSNCIIGQQNLNTRWESLTYDSNQQYTLIHSVLAAQSGSILVPPHKLLKGLLCSENLRANLSYISVDEDMAIVCNTLRRYILTNPLINILSDVISFNEQEILIQFFRIDEPKRVLLEGVIDLSVFLYPRVNACRFAIELRPPQKIDSTNISVRSMTTARSSKVKTRKSSVASAREPTSDSLMEGLPIPFVIVNICLMTPITEKAIEQRLGTVRLHTCLPKPKAILPKGICMVEKVYKELDDLVFEMIDAIVKHNLMDYRGFLCSQMGNLTNKILKLVQYDFNVRHPTRNSKEFHNLMTIVYKELMSRIYDALESCSAASLKRCVLPSNESKKQIIRFMSILKLLYESGDTGLCGIINAKLKKLSENCSRLDFYIMIYDVECQRFDKAKQYLDRPLSCRFAFGEYYAGLIRIYISYMEKLQDEFEFNGALNYVLIALKDFAEQNPLMIEPWVLLFCFYKQCSYLPGMSYARWQFENLYDSNKLRENFPVIPKSRWGLYHSYKLNFTSMKGKHFYKIVRLMLHLGMYKFGEIVLAEIIDESNNDLQNYLVELTLRMLMNDFSSGTATQYFTNHKPYVEENMAHQEHVNGNLSFYLGDIEPSLLRFRKLLNLDNLSFYLPFRLGIMRYAFEMEKRERYADAIKAFSKLHASGDTLVPSVALGKILYKLDRLKEAEFYLSDATKHKLHIPDVWAYLAMINLRLGRNFRALESWKYAKIRPDTVISAEVLAELRKVDVESLVLYVEKPRVKSVSL